MATTSNIPPPRDIAFERGGDYRHSALFVKDLFLAGDPETLEVDLALVAIGNVEMLNATRAVLSRSMALNQTLTAENVRLRDEITRLRRTRDEAL